MNKLTRFIKQFPRTFWTANTMELFERWAFYGFFMLFANYLTKSTDTGALGLSQTEKGIIMGVGTAILYLLPVFTGALADRWGFKRSLWLAFSLYFLSFLLMPYCRTFSTVLLNYIFLAIGAALFKPVISATIAHTTNDETASIGFGLYYMMVNIGAFIGPLVALQFNEGAFHLVFQVSAALIGINMLVLIFFKEPARKVAEGNLSEAFGTIFNNIFTTLKDLRFLVFLLIVAGFWTMYYQLFYTLSVFIGQWVNSTIAYNWLNEVFPWLAQKIGSSDGTIQAEYFTNLDALFIITFQLVVSTIIMRWRPLNAMITGFLLSTIGMSLTLITNNPFFIVGAIFIFGIGEMAGSPKITEYIGRIAPSDKKALYMGFSYLPVALANILAGIVSGVVYQNMADKVTIVLQEFKSRGIAIQPFSDSFTQNDLFSKASADFGLTPSELTNFLWDKYHPGHIWMVMFGIGMISVIALYMYDKTLPKKSE